MVYLIGVHQSDSVGTVEDGWLGRLEDRRPASNADLIK